MTVVLRPVSIVLDAIRFARAEWLGEEGAEGETVPVLGSLHLLCDELEHRLKPCNHEQALSIPGGASFSAQKKLWTDPPIKGEPPSVFDKWCSNCGAIGIQGEWKLPAVREER